jgi:hypothetical protein
MASDVINFAHKLARFSEHWSPRGVAEMNDYQFKLVTLQGEFVWHDHRDTAKSATGCIVIALPADASAMSGKPGVVGHFNSGHVGLSARKR